MTEPDRSWARHIRTDRQAKRLHSHMLIHLSNCYPQNAFICFLHGVDLVLQRIYLIVPLFHHPIPFFLCILQLFLCLICHHQNYHYSQQHQHCNHHLQYHHHHHHVKIIYKVIFVVIILKIFHFEVTTTTVCLFFGCLPPRWPSGKASTSRAEDPGFESRLRRDFLGSGPVATLPGAWCYRVNAGTGRPGVRILWLSEVESLICNFYLSVAARKNCLSRSVPEIH